MSLVRTIVKRFSRLVNYIAELPVLQLCIGIICGAVVSSTVSLGLGLVWLILSVCIRKILGRWTMLGIGFVIVGIRMFLVSNELPEDHISTWNEQEVKMTAVVTSDINMKPEKCNVVVEATKVCDDNSGGCKEIEGKVITWIPRFPRVKNGDVLVLKGKLGKPEDFETNDKFSYEAYLADKGIYSLMYRPGVEYTDERQLFFALRWLNDFRDLLLDKINRSLPEPHASLLAGILLGARRNMPEDFAEALQRTGTTHVIAASGYNVTLVINAVVAVLKFLNRRLRIIVSMAFIWVFVIMSGGSLPVVRAAIMGCFSLVALLLGRSSLVHVALSLSGAVMVLIDPSVISSISFQLSFLSTAGLIYLVPVLEKVFPWVPEGLKDSTLVTVAAILVTFPITVFNFGQFSVVAVVANFLVLPVIELAMGLGMLVVLTPSGLGVVTQLVNSIAWVPLEYFVKVVKWLGSLSFAMVELPEFPVWGVALFYAALVLLIILKYPSSEDNYFFKDLRI